MDGPGVLWYTSGVGTFREPIEIMNPAARRRAVSLEAVVDTGAAYSLVPAHLLRRIGIKPRRSGRFKVADGRVIERKMGLALARVKGAETPTWVIFGDDRAEALLGALTLEELGLGVDGLHRTLVTIATFPLVSGELPRPGNPTRPRKPKRP